MNKQVNQQVNQSSLMQGSLAKKIVSPSYVAPPPPVRTSLPVTSGFSKAMISVEMPWWRCDEAAVVNTESMLNKTKAPSP